MKIQITAKHKALHGTSKSMKLRKDNMLPGVICDHGKSIPIYLTDARSFSLLFEKGMLHNSVEILMIDDSKLSYHVKTHKIQKDPISSDFLHVDFLTLSPSIN